MNLKSGQILHMTEKLYFRLIVIKKKAALELVIMIFYMIFVPVKQSLQIKLTYNTAEFSHPRKISVTTDKQGVVNSTYEGTLIFELDKDYYSVIVIVTLLEKGGNILGAKMHLKENNRKEYAFSLKPSS